MNRSARTLVAGCLLLFAISCVGEDEGTFSVRFEWDGEPPDRTGLYVVARVEYAPDGKDPQTLASAGPESLTAGGTLAFDDVPVGFDRRVRAEIREERGSESFVRYYGISDRFELRAGNAVSVPVRVKLKAVLGVDDERTGTGITVDGLEAGRPVASTEVTLLVTAAPEARSIDLSNVAGFPNGSAMRIPLGPDRERSRQDDLVTYAVEWNLDYGRPAEEACKEVNFCPRTVFGRLVDAEGYVSRVYEPRLVVDKKSPDILGDTVSLTLEPDATNALVLQNLRSQLQSVGRDARIRVAFAMDEPVGQVRVAGIGAKGLELPFERTADDGNGEEGVSFVFERRFESDGDLIGSAFEIVVEAVDRAGNRGTNKLDSTFTADTVAPLATAETPNGPQLTYVRRPYGPDAKGEPKPYFAIQGDPLSVEPGTTLVLYDGPDSANAQRLGVAIADPEDGSVDQELIRRDVPQIYAVAIDSAGNQSALTLVRRVEWTGTFNGRVAGSTRGNPHRFDNRPWFLDVLDGGEGEVGDEDGLGDPDVGVAVRGSGRWEGTTLGPRPDSRIYPRAAYDRARGRLVLFGGRKPSGGPDCDDGGSNLCSGPWEWDGRRWELRQISDTGSGLPARREEHALAWDGRRGRIVMFGGRGPFGCEVEDSTFCSDTWAYDGSRFELLSPGGSADEPRRRTRSTLSYDERRDRMVLYGGAVEAEASDCAEGTKLCDDTWEWDGAQWERVEVSDGPGARKGHASAYDPISGTTLVFGGERDGSVLGDTWAFDGERWRQLDAMPATGSAPSARHDAAMTFNERLGRVVLFGGDANGADCDGAEICATLWSFDGSRWETVPLADADDDRVEPPGMTQATASEDSFGNVVLLGGGNSDAMYTFRDGRYRERSGVLHGEQPAPRTAAALASDPETGKTVLFGGVPSASGRSCPQSALRCNDTWLWDGSGWAMVTGATRPPACEQSSLTLDAAIGAARLLGGRTGQPEFCNREWRFDFATKAWSEGSALFATSDSTRPTPRLAHTAAMADGGLVLIGGFDGIEQLADVWQLGSSGWLQWPSLPLAVQESAAVTFGSEGTLVVFGGEYPARYRGENQSLCEDGAVLVGETCLDGQTWVGGEDGWNLVDIASGPLPRSKHTITHVDARSVPILFGGGAGSNCGSGVNECNDLWEWHGDRWIEVTPADPEHDGNPAVRIDHSMTYDAVRGEALLFGGMPSLTNESFDDTWIWHPGHDAAPAQVARFDFGSTDSPVGTQLQELELSWDADATSDSGDGAELWAFFQGRFQRAADAGLEETEDGVWRATDAAVLERLPFGPQRILGFAQRPRGSNGTLPEFARVKTRAVQLRVVYVLPEPEQ